MQGAGLSTVIWPVEVGSANPLRVVLHTVSRRKLHILQRWRVPLQPAQVWC